jgi:ribosomal-protein-alanine N-acetyltransferase
MAVLDWINPESGLSLEGERVWLRPPRSADFRAWAELRHESRAFLQPWEPTWPADDLTRAAFRRRLSIYGRDQDMGQGYAFFIFRKSDNLLLGGLNLREIRRGVAQTGALGYWIGARHARHGYTLDAVRQVVRFAFERLALHRLEAACLPENEASRLLLQKAGFDQEGFARGYLKIDGRWRDHLLFAKVNPRD